MKKLAITLLGLAVLSIGIGIAHALISININTDAASYSPGDTVTATSTVTNNDGAVKKDVFVDFVYENPVGATLSTETKTIKRINAGKSKSVSSTYNLASGATSGTYTVRVSARSNGSIDDTAQTTFDVGGNLRHLRRHQRLGVRCCSVKNVLCAMESLALVDTRSAVSRAHGLAESAMQ